MTNPKHYYRPQTLAEAIARTAQPGSIALVGGAMTLGGVLLPYETLIDLQDLQELKQIDRKTNNLHLGGGVSLQELVSSAEVPAVLTKSITRTLPINIRNNASVAESLTAKEPPREWLALLVAMGAHIEHAGSLKQPIDHSSFWEQPVAEFIQYLHLHHRSYQGIIVELRVPLPARSTRIGTAYVARTPADEPIVNAAVQLTLAQNNTIRQAVAAVGGASTLPIIELTLRPLIDKPLDEAVIANTVKFVMSSVQPVGDWRGSVEYRRTMAGVCIRRALERCLEQSR